MTIVKPKKKVNYLKNKDILVEIHKSKQSFNWLKDPKYSMYDLILDDVKLIGKKYVKHHIEIVDEETGEVTHPWDEPRTYIQDARENRAKRIQSLAYAAAVEIHNKANPNDYKNKPKQKEFYLDPKDIEKSDLVFRVNTFDHIPLNAERKKNPKKEADHRDKVNFPPFKHYAYIDNKLVEVSRSHWKGDLTEGSFCADHGELTSKLGMQFLMLVERYSRRSNWRGYTYVDEMRGQALLQLSQIALQFDESKSDNPFAYYTATITNSFRRVLNTEKRNQDIRDSILVDQGHLPSYGKQLDHEEKIRLMRDSVADVVETTQNEDL
jgi:hypothetical protein